ncbi:MAG: C40 family peptidase [Methylococcaceae bacterium]|jgi:cell wall-associated NlpC family hydrolase
MVHIKQIVVSVLVLGATLWFSGCATQTSTHAASPELLPMQSNVVQYALSLKGAPYRYGKDSPTEGFDCSGFIKHVYEKQGFALPRTAQEMAKQLPYCPAEKMQAGDLVFFNTNGAAYSHVGLYLGDEKFIHAPSQNTGKVLISDFNNNYWKKHFTGVRRPLPQ